MENSGKLSESPWLKNNPMQLEEINKITGKILDCAYKVHTELGLGLLESAYEECLFYELVQSGLKVEKQKALPLVYQEVKLEIGYRIDLLIEIR